MRLCCLLRGGGCFLGVLAAEALDTACGVDKSLFAGEERMAVGADFKSDLAFVGRASLERVSTRAVNLGCFVCRVNSGLGHDVKIPFLQSS